MEVQPDDEGLEKRRRNAPRTARVSEHTFLPSLVGYLCIFIFSRQRKKLRRRNVLVERLVSYSMITINLVCLLASAIWSHSLDIFDVLLSCHVVYNCHTNVI
jgi:hypothetical protein